MFKVKLLKSDNCVGCNPRFGSKRPRLGTKSRGGTTFVECSTTTERVFEQVDRRRPSIGAGGAGGTVTYQNLKRLEQTWERLRTSSIYGPRPEFIRTTNDMLTKEIEYDVIVAGGTLGCFTATALARRGWKVAVIEASLLQGRDQDWNISKKELLELVKEGVLTADEAEDCISIEFNPVRACFGEDGEDVTVRDVLNLGVSPKKLIDRAKENFEKLGGVIFENSPLKEAWVYKNGVSVVMQSGQTVTGRLLVDAMGNNSPVVRQVRHGKKPDGVCLVVGTCSAGFDSATNTAGDLIVTTGPSSAHWQYFWEAFPAAAPDPTTRTTYMFTYVDASPVNRPSLQDMFDDYWKLMPEYQGVSSMEQLTVLRVLYGMFPAYKDSPLQVPFNRVLAVGDASGVQSPLSFGGFGALTRHLGRVTGSIGDALKDDALLTAESLALINCYSPSLRCAWMMQKAMSIPSTAGASRDLHFINKLLDGNFGAMEQLGDAVLRPFLQDVVQLQPLTRTLLGQVIRKPLFVIDIFKNVGFAPLAEWVLHYMWLSVYTGLALAAERYRWLEKAENLPLQQRFMLKRSIESWIYGSGLDYKL